ncbi:hypothetical protein DL93DRAFT_2101881 [Clavulina sp. PMI_390]|nr:hypothetical protein DL93DRAFT_2101881 [Clavulina sp. PMI_390]
MSKGEGKGSLAEASNLGDARKREMNSSLWLAAHPANGNYSRMRWRRKWAIRVVCGRGLMKRTDSRDRGVNFQITGRPFLDCSGSVVLLNRYWQGVYTIWDGRKINLPHEPLRHDPTERPTRRSSGRPCGIVILDPIGRFVGERRISPALLVTWKEMKRFDPNNKELFGR